MSNSEQNALWKIWDDRAPITIPGTQYTLRGFSLAALRTNFYIPELGVMLDGGLSASYAPEHIFITHTHSDHIASLPFHLYSSSENRIIQIYAPEESCPNLSTMIKSITDINENYINPEFADVSNKYYELIPLKPGKLQLYINKKKFVIDIIQCHHGIPCLGYGFSEVRNKLKEEYINLTGKEIGDLRKKGIEITNEVEYPFLCFLGDTSNKILSNKLLEKYKNIMIECTFVEQDDIDQASKTHHMHWNYLKPYIVSHPDNNFILYHFSRRYKKSVLEEFFKQEALVNVIPWIN